MRMEPRVAAIVRLMRVLDRSEADTGVGIAERRAAAARLSHLGAGLVMPRGPEPASTDDILVPVDGGRITVRLYRPHGPGPHPMYVFLHGGGWCIGTIEERDARCRAISAGASCTVASVDYRMAPENQYPTAPEDCYAALCWLVEHADEVGIDATRVASPGCTRQATVGAKPLCRDHRERFGKPQV